MSSAHALRVQLEQSLSHRIPSALTMAPRVIRPVEPFGIRAVDELLHGGLPLGAITEVVGPECSGRTSLAVSFIAGMTQSGKVCAWVDVSSMFHPESASASGIDLARLLWVRCGLETKKNACIEPDQSFQVPKEYFTPPAIKKGLHGGGCGGHPRMEANGLSDAIGGLLRPEAIVPRCAEPQRRLKVERAQFSPMPAPFAAPAPKPISSRPWSRIEQALHVTDLLLQAGGFAAIVLDMGSVAPEFVSRVPLATWFRYRAAAERSQASIMLLTQHACAKSSAGLVLRLQTGSALEDEATVFTGVQYRAEVVRERFAAPASNVIPLRRPPQRESGAGWRSRTLWAASR